MHARGRLWLWLVALISWFTLLPRVAAEAGTGWTLRWSAPKACPSERQVSESVRAMLARSPQVHDTPGIRAISQVRRAPAGYALDLILESPTGSAHEQLVAARCETLAGVVALKIVLAADPGAWFAALQSAPAEPARSRAFALRVGASAGPGVLPGAGAAFELTGRLKLAWASVELGAGYGLRNDAYHHDHPEVGAALDLFFLSARFCAVPRVAALEIPLCAGPDLGLMRGRGFGVQDPRTWMAPWAAVAAGPGLRWLMTPWSALYAGAAAFVALARPTYRVQDLTPERIYTPARFGARFQVGVELGFE